MDLVTIITPIYNGEKYLERYFTQIEACLLYTSDAADEL